MEVQPFMNMVIEPWTKGGFPMWGHYFVLSGSMIIGIVRSYPASIYFGIISGIIFQFIPLEFAYSVIYWLPKIVKFLWP